MHIDQSYLQKISALARLEVDPHKATALIEDLNCVFTWFEQLSTLDTTGIEPLVTVAGDTTMSLQEERLALPLGREAIFSNALHGDTHYFSVPQIKD